MGLLGARDVEALLRLDGLGHVEPEGGKPSGARPGGAELQKVAARDLWHPIPPRERFCRRLKLSVLTGLVGCQPRSRYPSPACWGGQGGGVTRWRRDEPMVRGAGRPGR